MLLINSSVEFFDKTKRAQGLSCKVCDNWSPFLCTSVADFAIAQVDFKPLPITYMEKLKFQKRNIPIFIYICKLIFTTVSLIWSYL